MEMAYSSIGHRTRRERTGELKPGVASAIQPTAAAFKHVGNASRGEREGRSTAFAYRHVGSLSSEAVHGSSRAYPVHLAAAARAYTSPHRMRTNARD